MSDTIRERFLKALEANFRAIRRGEPIEDPYLLEWALVTREPFSGREAGKDYCLMIADGDEVKEPIVQRQDCTLEVNFMFRAFVPPDAKQSEYANMVIGEIQRTVGADHQLGGLVNNVLEVGNTYDLDRADDRYIEGNVICHVRYKHGVVDPRSLV